MSSYSTENEPVKDISMATLESTLAHMQEVNRRLATVTIIALLVMGLMFAGVLYFLTGFEVSTESIAIDSHQGTAIQNGVQSVLDTICQDKIDSKNEKILELQNSLNMANLAASQTAQTAEILAKLPATATTGA